MTPWFSACITISMLCILNVASNLALVVISVATLRVTGRTLSET
uniref:Uncharacterized protein n=1 Tax=Klebsiella phage PMBT70 TaxID=3229741 RepID=A0AB39C423_9CAUD